MHRNPIATPVSLCYGPCAFLLTGEMIAAKAPEGNPHGIFYDV